MSGVHYLKLIDTGTTQLTEQEADPNKVIKTTSRDTASSEDTMPLEKLYPNQSDSHDFSLVLKLLNKAKQHADSALLFIREDNLISADNSIMQIQAMLPEMFCFRHIGDGYGLIISSLFNAFTELKGLPLNEEQLININYTLKSLSDEPFMTFERAMDFVDGFENSGLIVESVLTDTVLEAFAEEH